MLVSFGSVNHPNEYRLFALIYYKLCSLCAGSAAVRVTSALAQQRRLSEWARFIAFSGTGTVAVTSGPTNHRDFWTNTGSISRCRIPNLSNNDKPLIETLKIVWEGMNNSTILSIFNNTCEKWNDIWLGELGNIESQIEIWMMNGTFYPTVSNTSRKSRMWTFSTHTPRTSWMHYTYNLKWHVSSADIFFPTCA